MNRYQKSKIKIKLRTKPVFKVIWRRAIAQNILVVGALIWLIGLGGQIIQAQTQAINHTFPDPFQPACGKIGTISHSLQSDLTDPFKKISRVNITQFQPQKVTVWAPAIINRYLLPLNLARPISGQQVWNAAASQIQTWLLELSLAVVALGLLAAWKHSPFKNHQTAEKSDQVYKTVKIQGREPTVASSKDYEEMVALYQLGQLITTLLPLDVVLEVIANSTAKLIGVDASAVLLLDRSQQTLQVGSAYSLNEQFLPETGYYLGDGVTGQAIQTRQPIFINDLPNHPQFSSAGQAKKMLAWASIPLIVDQEIIGVLEIYSRTNRYPFSQ